MSAAAAAPVASAAAPVVAATSDVPIPVMTTMEEARRMNALFYYVWTASHLHGLETIVKLMQQVATGAANRAILQGINEMDYFIKLVSIPDDPHVNIDAVTFDATQPAGDGLSLLHHWAVNADTHSAYQVRTTFELLQRSGGVTLAAALSDCQNTSPNTYARAINSKHPYWVNCLLSDSTLDEGWGVVTTHVKRTTLILAMAYLHPKESIHRILQLTSDEAINAPDRYGNTALVQSITICYPSILEALLLRLSLNLNPTPSLRTDTHLQFLNHSSTIISVFDKVARVFDVVPSLIHDALYDGFEITLPLPVCTIIYHYYRMPYPICECPPALLAAAPTKHSPFCFCFPPQ